MEATPREIIAGESICKKLKNLYFANTEWQLCYKDVGKKFTILKRIMRKFHTDLDTLDILKKIDEFDSLDFDEAFSLEEDYIKEKKESPVNKYADKVVWVPVPVDKTELLGEIRKMLA